MPNRAKGFQRGLTMSLWYTLFKLSELGTLNTHIQVSTIEAAKKIGISQQTASRHMILLENNGYLERRSSPYGNYIRVTQKGREELERVYLRLKNLIEEAPKTLTLEGTVVNGLGEGAYYMSRKRYREQFVKKLGFDPFPGTLNLKVHPSTVEVRKKLEILPGIKIHGFKTGDRVFGEVKCFSATINDEVKGAVALIDRTHHNDSVIELIAPLHLRSRLDLKEGTRVQVNIHLMDR